MSSEKDDAAPLPTDMSATDVVKLVQTKRLEWLLTNNTPDKETLALAKDLAKTAIDEQRIQTEQDGNNIMRETVAAIAHHIAHNPNSSRVLDHEDASIEPPTLDAPLVDVEISEDNMSTKLGSPSYDEIMGDED
jgi:hypothetical protein